MNSQTFQVGEVVIFIRPGSRFHGGECVIVSGLAVRSGYDPLIKANRTSLCYRVRHQGQTYVNRALPAWLRKKKPPAREIDRVVAWKDCAWHPESAEV